MGGALFTNNIEILLVSGRIRYEFLAAPRYYSSIVATCLLAIDVRSVRAKLLRTLAAALVAFLQTASVRLFFLYHLQSINANIKSRQAERAIPMRFRTYNLERVEDGLVPSATAVKTELRFGDRSVVFWSRNYFLDRTFPSKCLGRDRPCGSTMGRLGGEMVSPPNPTAAWRLRTYLRGEATEC